MNLRSPRIIIFFFLIALFGIVSNAKSQIVQRTTGGTARDFQVRVTNSFGVRTSIEGTRNFQAQNNAIINLAPGSSIVDAFGDSSGNANASFVATPTGGNMNINGIQSVNSFTFAEGTQFQSQSSSIANPDPTIPIKGTSSSMGVHEMSLTIQSQQQQFGSSFSQSF